MHRLRSVSVTLRVNVLKYVVSAALIAALLMVGASSAHAQIARPIPRYDFDIDLDYFAHRLDATQRVTLPNSFDESISEVVFNVPAAHTPGVFDLQQVMVGNAPATYHFAGTKLTIELLNELKPDDVITLTLKFSVRVLPLDATSFAGANLAYTSDATNIGYWYPLLAPYRSGTGWIEVPFYPIGDPFASESADYSATITATPGVTVVSGGELSRRGNMWHYDLPRGRTFGMLASPRYQQTSVTVNHITYSIYTLPEHTHLATIALQTMIRAVWLYSSIYGPYPYSTLRVAEVTGPWSMEFSGFCALGATDIGDYDGTTRNRLIRIAAHEVSHQWWYSVVGDNQVTEPWLDEGMARFNELRYYEAYSPEDVPWWWDSVIGTLRNPLPLNSSVADFTDHGRYLQSIYNQGAVFLDALRARIGQPAFNTFMRDLYRRGSFRLITTQDFFDILENHTEVNVQPLVRKYFK